MPDRKESTIDILIEQVSSLPYWVGVSTGLLSYIVLHHFSDLSILQNTGVEPVDGFIVAQTVKVFAYFGQFFIPFVCFLGAYLSARKAARQGRFFSSSIKNKRDSLRQLHEKEFRDLITDYYRRKGFTVIDTPGGSDGDTDIHLTQGGEYYIVLCRHWKKDLVGESNVKEQYAMLHHHNADKVIIVASGEYSPDAMDFAAGKPIELVDGRQLKRFLGSASVARQKSSVDAYLPMVMTMGCFMFFLIFLISDLKNNRGNVAGSASIISVSAPLQANVEVENTSPGKPLFSGTTEQVKRQPEQPAETVSPGNHNIYTYTYKDDYGVFKTITSSVWLDYKIVDGKLHYYGQTMEEKELAALLNETSRNKSY